MVLTGSKRGNIFFIYHICKNFKYKKNFEKYTPFATSVLLTTNVRRCVEERRTLDFKKQYFEIWQEVWTLHKKYQGKKFLQSLLLAVCAELERESKHEEN